MKTTYRLVDFALKRVPTDGSGFGTAIAYGWGAKDEEPVIDRGGLYVERLPLPLLWQHERGVRDPDTIIGRVTAERTTPEGWEVDFKLDLSNDLAVKIYERMLNANDGQFSIGHSIEDKHMYKADDGLIHLRRSEVIEVSVVTVGANRGTRLVSLKAAEVARRASSIRVPEAASADDLRRAVLDRADAIMWLSKARGITTAEAGVMLAREDGKDFDARIKAMFPAGAEALKAAERRKAAAQAAVDRRKAAHRRLDELYALNPEPMQVVLDRRGRVVGGDEADREAARQAREAKEREHRARERERERVAAEAGAQSLQAGSTTQVTRGA